MARGRGMKSKEAHSLFFFMKLGSGGVNINLGNTRPVSMALVLGKSIERTIKRVFCDFRERRNN